MSILLFLSVVTVRHDQTLLRAGCSADESPLATLALGTPVDIRFAYSDGSDCYKVNASVDGRRVEGFVAGRDLAGIEEFERQLRDASDGSSVRMMIPVPALQRAVAVAGNDPALRRAAELLAANQPNQALAILEPMATRNRDRPDLLAMTGFAAYRADQIRTALDYWKRSLELRPDASLAAFCKKVEREEANDRSTEKLAGMRVLLRYEGANLPAETARSLVEVLDEEWIRVSEELGCRSEERIVAIVQSRQAYLRSTDAAEWSGGQYDGRIHVSMPDAGVAGRRQQDTRRLLAHEIVHACLTNLPARWPAWLQEGLAQKLSGDTLSSAARLRIKQMADAHELPRLENVAQSWSRMSAQHARIAYDLALAAAEALTENYRNYGLRNILASPERLPSITVELDKALGL